MVNEIVLAIETSIKSGSLAILSGNSVIDNWTGNDEVSRSEDLVPQIEFLLKKNSLKLRDISRIAVSIGPGSFTGIRVGIAVAKGLSTALDCPLTGVSILEAVCLSEISDPAITIIPVVYAGRDLLFWQTFRGGSAIGEPSSGDIVLLQEEAGKFPSALIIAEDSAFQNLKANNFACLQQTTTVNENLAELIGICSLRKVTESDQLHPLYIRPAVIVKTK